MNVDRAIALTAVAVAGLAGLGSLGRSFHGAVAGAADGPAALVHAEAGLASTVSKLTDAERIAENFAEAPAGLYGMLDAAEPAGDFSHASYYWRDVHEVPRRGVRFSPAGYRRLTRFQCPYIWETAYQTELDLLTELSRLDLWRVRGVDTPVRGASLDGRSVRWSPVHEDVSIAIANATQGLVTETRRLLGRAREALREADRPVPEDFFARIVAVAQIHHRGVDPATFERLFRRSSDGAARGSDAGSADALDDALFDVLGRFPGTGLSPDAFAMRYRAAPEAALSALDERARKYLETEVIPFLQSVRAPLRGELTRVLTKDGEAQVLGHIVRGDAEGAAAALAAGRTASAMRAPKDLKEAVRFSASLFEPAPAAPAPRFRPFEFAELMDLVRFDDDALARLGARGEGGAELADVAQAVRNAQLVLLPGRSAEHLENVFTEWLRTVARGDAVGFAEYEAHANHIVREVPRALRDALEGLLGAFRTAAE